MKQNLRTMFRTTALLLVIVLLSGCQLADPDKGQYSEDRLIGAFVTAGDAENDIYYGKAGKNGTYIFEGLSGKSVFLQQKEIDFYAVGEPDFYQTNMQVTETEQDTCCAITCTYFSGQSKDTVYRVHGIYRTCDGTVYINTGLSEGGISADLSQGAMLTQELHGKTPVKDENGKETLRSITLTVQITGRIQ